jgi:hypothetical protein
LPLVVVVVQVMPAEPTANPVVQAVATALPKAVEDAAAPLPASQAPEARKMQGDKAPHAPMHKVDPSETVETLLPFAAAIPAVAAVDTMAAVAATTAAPVAVDPRGLTPTWHPTSPTPRETVPDTDKSSYLM